MMSLDVQKQEKINFLKDCKISELSRSSKISSSVSLVLVIAYFISIKSGENDSASFMQMGSCLFLFIVLFLRFLHANNPMSHHWLNKFTFLTLMVASGWAASFIVAILENENNIKVLLVTFAVFTGIISSASYTLAISKRDFLIFTSVSMIPIVYKFNILNYGTSFQVSINIILLSFYIFLLRQQKQIEEAWIEQRTINFELKRLMNLFPGGIAVLKEGLHTKTNNYFEKILKEMSENSHVRNLVQNIHEFSILKKIGRHQWQVEIPLKNEPRTHLVIVENMDSLSGVETVVTVVDIEDYRRIEKENLAQKANLEQSAKMAALGVMASGLAHEINNPLAIILARVQLMQMSLNKMEPSPIVEKWAQSIEIVDSTVKRISKVVKSLRSFSRETSHDPFENVLLSEVVDMTLGFCGSKIQSLGIHFENKMDLSLAVFCRPSEISQVLLNAINNSMDAVSKSDSKWIRLETEVEENWIKVKVTDAGSGIDVSIREKIMIPFFTTKEVGSGAGLGLSLSKGIVESHGGKLYFDYNSPNTQLVIVLPKAPTK